MSKSFASGLLALDKVSLDIRPGEFLTLLGPSGCGKSTLLRIIAGLSVPSAGSVVVSGGAMAPRRAFVFQQPTLMPWARVAANVRLPLDLEGVSRGDAERRVSNALQLVGLAEFAEAWPRELSGGMQMRVSIARALVTEPHLLLMDEPFAALDEVTRHRLDRELLHLWRARGLTVVFVTHSIVEAVFLSTRVALLTPRPGRIAGETLVDAPVERSEDWRLSADFAERAARLSRQFADAERA